MSNRAPSMDVHGALAGAQARQASYRSAGWWPGIRLVDRFTQHLAANPLAHAVRDENQDWLTRADLWAAARAFADDFTAHGVGAGDVVIICLPNRVAWQSLLLACLRIGAIPATIPVTSDAETLRYVAELVAAKVLIVPVAQRARDFGAELVAGSAAAELTVLIGDDDSLAWHAATVTRVQQPSAIDGLAHLMFTSSTTGMPKAVAHTEDTLAAVNIAFAERFGIDGTEPIFMGSPMGHSVGSWHGARLALFTGAPLVLRDSWNPAASLQTIADEGCVFTAAATPFLKDLVDLQWSGATPKLASVRAFLCGGAPVPPALLAAAAEQMPGTFITVLWGMTEGGVTTCHPGDPAERVATSAGVGLPGLELCTVDLDGIAQPAGTSGELAMRGPGVFVGYYGQDELYRELMTADGYFRTGDLAVVDGSGYLTITGRLKDLIIRGGVNISPIPLENALSAHPSIQRVAVIGTPDDRMGERICAVIVPNGTVPTLDELLAWLGQSDLSRRQWPEELIVVDRMPVTAAGKIRKPILRAAILESLS